MQEITKTLEERGSRYGSFKENSKVMCDILRAMKVIDENCRYSDYMIAYIIMDAAKSCRIAAGEPEYLDNIVDKAGYSQLVIDIIKESEDIHTDDKPEGTITGMIKG